MSMQRNGPQNYRVEAGQPIAEAFSATAWNRAQDAADIVLGTKRMAYGQPAVPYQFAIISPVKISSPEDQPSGTAITITDFEIYPNTTRLKYLTGEIMSPVALSKYETHSTVFPVPFAVAVEPIRAESDVIMCAVSGLCVARIRVISNQHRYVSVATDRTAAGGTAGEDGVLETSDMGFAKLLKTSSQPGPYTTTGLIVL